MRGSDPDAALYWLARMIHAGEDPRFIARRMVICAAEDVGLADPMAPPVRLGCGQGRRVRTALTVALIVTGVSAWALALVQPWTSRGVNVVMASLASGVDAERLSAPVDLEKQISETQAGTPPSLRRSPFGPSRAGAAKSPLTTRARAVLRRRQAGDARDGRPDGQAGS